MQSVTPYLPSRDAAGLIDFGDRDGSVVDPFGNHWYLASPLEQG